MQRPGRALPKTVTQEPPVIETARLLLDAHRPNDLDALAAMWTDPDVVRHIGGVPRTRQDSWFRLLRYRGLWPLMGYGYWAVREQSSGGFVGDVGFGAFERDLTLSIDDLPEAGWAFATAVHGRGYATEALTAALQWLDTATTHRQTVCLVAHQNRSSIHVAEKTGFAFSRSVKTEAGEEAGILMHRPAAIRV